jgi:hypothetical protein
MSEEINQGFKRDAIACVFLMLTLQLWPTDTIQNSAKMYGLVGVWVKS